MDGIEIGKRVRQLRGQRYQRQLTKRAGISQALWSQVERGHVRNPKLETLQALARGLDITLAELIDPKESST